MDKSNESMQKREHLYCRSTEIDFIVLEGDVPGSFYVHHKKTQNCWVVNFKEIVLDRVIPSKRNTVVDCDQNTSNV